MKPDSNSRDIEKAEILALSALAFIASEPERLARFLGESGLEPNDLKERAQSREVLEAALDALMSDEAALLAFAANAAVKPEEIVKGHHVLSTDGGRKRPFVST